MFYQGCIFAPFARLAIDRSICIHIKFPNVPHNLGLVVHCPKKKLYSKTYRPVKWPLSKRQKIGFQDQMSLNAGQKYCRMLQGELSAILATFIKLPFVIKIFFLSIFECPLYTGFTVVASLCFHHLSLVYTTLPYNTLRHGTFVHYYKISRQNTSVRQPPPHTHKKTYILPTPS